MQPEQLFSRYLDLQRYVQWNEADAARILAAAPCLQSSIPSLIDDFYSEIERHPGAAQAISGGPDQIARLKGTLRDWLQRLLAGNYDRDFVWRRWKVGQRHVEIGLDQVYTNAALSRIRNGLLQVLAAAWRGSQEELAAVTQSLNRLVDLDLALIEDAYQHAYLDRQKRIDQLAMLGQIAEEKIRSETTFRNLVDAAGCMIVILRPDHTIAYFNSFAQQLTGYTSAEVLGKDYFTLFAPANERESVRQAFVEWIEQDGLRNVQKSVVCRDGSTAILLWNGCRLEHFLSGPAMLGIGVDITRLKDAETKALRAERLAAIGQMVAGLAHEGRNALQRSQACLEMLDLEVGANREAQDLIRRIQRAQDQLHKLFDDLRGYVSPLQLDRADCRLDEIWREAWELLSAQRKGREIVFSDQALGLNPGCWVDRFRLVQVFRNLLENSLAACHDPVRIEISSQEAVVHGRPGVRVSVRDNGPGLTPEQKRRIFEPFFTTKTQGTGLGMAIAQRILEAHQGEISVGEGNDGGAEIVLLLPRQPAEE